MRKVSTRSMALRRVIEKTDDFTQAGERIRSMTAEERNRFLRTIVGDLKQCRDEVQLRVICNFFRADVPFGIQLSQELGVDISGYMQHAPTV